MRERCNGCAALAQTDMIRGKSALRCTVNGRIVSEPFPGTQWPECERPKWCGGATFPPKEGMEWPRR